MMPARIAPAETLQLKRGSSPASSSKLFQCSLHVAANRRAPANRDSRLARSSSVSSAFSLGIVCSASPRLRGKCSSPSHQHKENSLLRHAWSSKQKEITKSFSHFSRRYFLDKNSPEVAA